MIRTILSAGPQGRRRCLSPQFRTSHSRPHRGFTLVEIMMSLLLLAIGTALALPSYRDMVEKRQVTNAAEQLASFVNSAQGMAMKLNREVTIYQNRDGDADWCVGASFGADACDCEQTNPQESNFCQLDCDDQMGASERASCLATANRYVVNQTLSGGSDLMHSVSGSDSYTFDPVRGLVRAGLDQPLTMELRSPGGDFRINLIVNKTGRVILCSDDSSHSVPGYELCPAEFSMGS